MIMIIMMMTRMWNHTDGGHDEGHDDDGNDDEDDDDAP